MEENKFIDKIKEMSNQNSGISIRKIYNMDTEIFILYILQLTDRECISNSIIKPILEYDKERISIDIIARSIIYMDDISMNDDEEKILDYILKGKSIILIPNEEKYIVANTYEVEKRNVESPRIQSALKGPRDSFTENFETNLSLIRYRIKDAALRIDNFTIGERTKTNVAVVYIEDVANPEYVDDVKKRLKDIKVDGVVESGYVQKFIRNNTFDLFPQIGIAERSDTTCSELLNGKIAIIVEGSNLALLLPKTFIEFLDAGEDHYENIYLGVFTKFLRILAFLITLTLSSLYIAVVSFHPDILPPQYILVLATARITVPVNSLIEVTLMELVGEILKEASVRLPQEIGTAIGIVGTIVIGQAAVVAGLVSPLTVIIISLATMTSFAFRDHTIMAPIRILKFMLIFITGILGMFGFTMGITFIVINLISHSSFGVPYTAPVAPLNVKELKKFIFSDITLNKKRPRFLKPRDKKRQ
ncbi:spore germination protein [Clostridium ganghwense]|uniref:Spore germination protein n=1 Tax=Clostridium ganghwense TaxID=312089 RepID=A0ABT4CJK9_9CLOT|nr:spore germination protein [Clostridium ganghwense]MCY6369231.1 spore germination protein [Clostridium ganghwense]